MTPTLTPACWASPAVPWSCGPAACAHMELEPVSYKSPFPEGVNKPLGGRGILKILSGKGYSQRIPFPRRDISLHLFGEAVFSKAFGEGIFCCSIKREYLFPEGFCWPLPGRGIFMKQPPVLFRERRLWTAHARSLSQQLPHSIGELVSGWWNSREVVQTVPLMRVHFRSSSVIPVSGDSGLLQLGCHFRCLGND